MSYGYASITFSATMNGIGVAMACITPFMLVRLFAHFVVTVLFNSDVEREADGNTERYAACGKELSPAVIVFSVVKLATPLFPR